MPRTERHTQSNIRLQIEYWPISRLKPDPCNARTHSHLQRRRMMRSIKEFDMPVPMIVGPDDVIVCGNLRLEACQALGREDVPVIRVEHLSSAQIKAFQIAENRLSELGGWDNQILGETLRELSLENIDFDLELTGFDLGEIDLLIEGAGADTASPDPDDLPLPPAPLVTQAGDLWIAGRHRILCGNSLDPASYTSLMGGRVAEMTVADPPYNTPQRMIGGRGKIKHANFAMASGEMNDVEFTAFLTTACRLAADHCRDGSIAYWFIDWRHIQHLLAAGGQIYTELKNIAVWVKSQAGQGAFYRSQHEMVAIFKKGTAPHHNNIQLGRFGRSRSNVWSYASPAAFGRDGEEGKLLASHPTPKPVACIMDAILDVTARGDIVLDPFLGGGSSLLAAERSGRSCFGIELDPGYVDTCIRRLRRHSGEDAVRERDGRSFSSLEEEVVQ